MTSNSPNLRLLECTLSRLIFLLVPDDSVERFEKWCPTIFDNGREVVLGFQNCNVFFTLNELVVTVQKVDM